MSNKPEVVRLSVEGLKQDKVNGLTHKDMSDKYSLTVTQVAKAMKQAGLVGARAKSVKFVIE